MAVYKKTYRPYDGALTASATRLFVIARYAMEDLRRSKFLNIFYALSFAYPLVSALLIYLAHNTSALQLINFGGGPGVGVAGGPGGPQGLARVISINVVFFNSLLGWQSMLALFLAAFIGPGLISPDLANSALSLYLARPFSRVEYVLGKMSVLVLLMSLMTWIPCLLIFGLQGYLEGGGWAADNARIAWGMFFGSWLWIVLLSLLALALSAWVKWKPAAGALVFGVYFVGAAFAAVVNTVQRTNWGSLFDVGYLVGSVWVRLMEGAARTTDGPIFFRSPQGHEIPVGWCWFALVVLAATCLYMLARRIRGAEVVR
jgi:ABC-2 type transport system permease protein